jgi:hypothetical protein
MTIRLQPPATLLMGASGAGKTSALTTYLEAGIETFVLCTEPGGPESLIDWCETKKYDMDKLHWATCLPASQGWKGLGDMVDKISNMDFEQLAKIKSGIGKDECKAPAEKLLETIADFTCERTGKSYGDVTTWGPDRHFGLDSLSGVSLIGWNLTVGHKPTAHQGEWSIAMNFIADLLLKITSDRNCFFTLTAHIEKEPNEITGVNQIMVSTLGRKLAPKLPRFFSEVVYAQRTNVDPKFRWSTIDASADLKNRALPVSDKLQPSFVPLVQAYQKRMKAMGGAAAPSTATSVNAA